MALADTARLIAELTLDDKFSPKAQRVIRNVGLMEASFKNIRSHAREGLGAAYGNLKRIGLLATGVAVGGLIGATKAAIDFEDAFAGIRKTVDETDLTAAGLSFEQLSDGIRAMAREMPVAATDLAAIGEAAGALGVAGQDIEGFIGVVARLGVTTDLSTEQAATALGQLGTILNLSGKDYEDFADTLVALGNDGASTESQIIELSARFAAAGRQAGLTNNDILALSSAVASMGIEVEAGGGALSRIFNNITTNIGTSSVKAKAFADALGLSAAEFKTAWDRDALGTLQEFLTHLGTLDKFEAANLLKKIGITGVRDINTIQLMSQQIGFVNEALEISRTATGALGIEATEKFKTTASQIQILKNNLVDVGITIGNELLPVITDLTSEFVEFLNAPKTQGDIRRFAKDLAEGIRGIAEGLRKVDWESIAGSLKTAAEFGRNLMQVFLDAPEWLKTAIITGWGLNKLTGGALGSIVGELGKGLIKGVLGMNAGVVNINAARVTGIPAGFTPGAPKPTAAPLPGGPLPVLVTGIAAGVALRMVDEQAAQELSGLREQVQQLPSQTKEGLATGVDIAGFGADIINAIVPGQSAFATEIQGLREDVRSTAQREPHPVSLQPDTVTNLTQPYRDFGQRFVDQQVRTVDTLSAKFDRNNNGIVTMKEVLAERIGVSNDQLRGINTKESTVAERLGISVEQLRGLKAEARLQVIGINAAKERIAQGISSAKQSTVAELQRNKQQLSALQTTLQRKKFDPTINVNVRTNFNVSARTIARATDTWRDYTNTGGR